MDPQNHQKPKAKKQILLYSLVSLGMVLISATVTYGILRALHPGSASQQSNAVIGLPKHLGQSYRLYQSYSGRLGADSTLTLTDLNDKVIATHELDVPMNLIARMGEGSFLLKEDDFLTSVSSLSNVSNDDAPYGGSFWLLKSTGKLTRLNETANKILRQRAGQSDGTDAVYPVSDQEVLTYGCSDADTSYQFCGTYQKVNIVTGATVKIITDQAQLLGVSADGSTAFLYGSQSDNSGAEFIKYDLKNKKRLASVPLPEPTKGMRQIWVSPQGAYVTYADEAAQKIMVYSTVTKETTTVQLPLSWELNSWSGEVTLPTPQWSPDEKKIAFVAWTEKAQYMVTIDIATGSHKVIDTLDVSGDAPENESGLNSVHHSYEAFGWTSASNLDLSSIISHSEGSFGEVVNNYSSGAEGVLKKLPTTYGNLIEVNYSRPALF